MKTSILINNLRDIADDIRRCLDEAEALNPCAGGREIIHRGRDILSWKLDQLILQVERDWVPAPSINERKTT